MQQCKTTFGIPVGVTQNVENGVAYA